MLDLMSLSLRLIASLQVKRIEGVFSGTLSYIFNEYSSPKGGSEFFSTVVRIAKEKGYTVNLVALTPMLLLSHTTF